MDKPFIPSFFIAIGLIGVVLVPRVAAAQADFVTGLATGIFLGIEILGLLMMTRLIAKKKRLA